MDKPRLLDLFAGPGGWDEALKTLGRTDVLGVEMDADTCATRLAAGHATISADVRALDPLDFAPIEGLIASPPCQTFSSAGKQRGLSDPRGQLVYEVMRFAKALRPEWIACEQVKEVLPIWRMFANELRGLGYHAWAGVLNAADYGVPQVRKRAFLMASLRPITLPQQTHSATAGSMFGDYEPWITMANALGWDQPPPADLTAWARKPLAGAVAANVLAYGTGALNIDGCRVEAKPWTRPGGANAGKAGGIMGTTVAREPSESNEAGRWPTNVVLDPDAAAHLDAQTGTLTSGANPTRRGSDKFRDAYGDFGGQEECTPARGADSGGASRFFPTFRYEAKAPSHERPRVAGDPTTARQVADKGGSKRCVKCGKQAINVGNSSCSCAEPDFQHERHDGFIAHPTVKPLDLMRWLVRLVTPPGGVVLEPFAGSGTTAEACIVEGFRCIAIEREADYLPLILTRITKPIEPVLFGMEAS